MKYPTADLIRPVEFSKSHEILAVLERFCALRVAHVFPTVGVTWRFLIDGSVADQKTLLANALKKVTDNSRIIADNTLQIWFGIPPGDFRRDRIDFCEDVPENPRLGEPLTVRNVGTFLAEEWELGFVAGDLPLLSLTLSEAYCFGIELPSGISWRDGHLQFCWNVLTEELFGCVWNQFRGAPELSSNQAKEVENEFWADKKVLRRAIQARCIFTDRRTERERKQIKGLEQIVGAAEEVMGYTKSGNTIVRLQDTPAALTAFENQK